VMLSLVAFLNRNQHRFGTARTRPTH
jgi:hypothetical protein